MAVAIIPNRLSCSTWYVIMAAGSETMMIYKIDKPTFPFITFIIYVESVENHPLPNAPWKNRKNVLALIEILQANFCS